MFESSPEISFNVKFDSNVLCSMLIEYIEVEKNSILSKNSLLEFKESFNVVDQNSKNIVGSIAMMLSPKSKNVPHDIEVNPNSERSTVFSDSVHVEANDSANRGIKFMSMLNNSGKTPNSLMPRVNEIQEAAGHPLFEPNRVEEEEFEMKPDVSSLHRNLNNEPKSLITDRVVTTRSRRSVLKKSIRQSVICGNPNLPENSVGNGIRNQTRKQKTCTGVIQTRNMLGRIQNNNNNRVSAKWSSERGSFFCTQCKFRSTSKHYVKKHFKNVHRDLFVHCEMCTLSTRLKGNLRRHYYLFHKLDKERTHVLLNRSKFTLPLHEVKRKYNERSANCDNSSVLQTVAEYKLLWQESTKAVGNHRP